MKSFSGQKVTSLKILFRTMTNHCSKRQNIKYSEVTLPDVAEYANSVFSNSKVKETTKTRQQEVIDYFEESVK